MEVPTTAWDSVYCVRPYNPHKIDGRRNPAFDRVLDGRLLDLKEGQYHAVRAEMRVFRAALAQLSVPVGALLAIVPGHRARPSNAEHPLAWVAEELAARDPRLQLRCDCIIRTVTIPRLASGGERTLDTHLCSLSMSGSADVGNATVILIDDIVTTGNSIAAARQLLMPAGASRVAAIALARTVWYSGGIAA